MKKKTLINKLKITLFSVLFMMILITILFALGLNENKQIINTIVIIICFIVAVSVYATLKLINSLNNFSKELLVSVNSLNNSTSEISSGNQDLSSRTQRQVSTVEQAVAALKDFSASMRTVSENSSVSNKLSDAAVATAKEGNNISKNTKQAMIDITQSSNQIAEIVGLVNEIAFQTNILAINAAIEAAKAGEQGKGFAVVAIEVRNLAQRSADAAREIQILISSSLEKVEIGTKFVEDNYIKIQEVVECILKASELIDLVSNESEQQLTSIDQMMEAMAEIDNTAQSNSALVEQITSSSQSLHFTTTDLKKLILDNLFDKKNNLNNFETKKKTFTIKPKVKDSKKIEQKINMHTHSIKETENKVVTHDLVESILSNAKVNDNDKGEVF